MARTKIISEKVNQDEKAQGFVPDKRQDRTSENQPNEVEIGNIPEKEFRIMIVKIIQDLRKKKKKWRQRLRCKKCLPKS